MKNKRRSLAVILSLVMAASMALTACSDKDDDESSSKKSKDSSSSVSVSSSEADSDSSSDSNSDSSVADDDKSSDAADDSKPDDMAEAGSNDDESSEYTYDPEPEPDDPGIVVIEPDSSESEPDTTTTATAAGEISPEEKPIYDMFEAMETGDLTKYENVLPDEIIKVFKDNNSWDILSQLTKQTKESYGDDCKITVSIKGKTELTDSDIEDYKNKYLNGYGIDLNIEKGYLLNIKAKVSGSIGSQEDEDSLGVGYVNGRWVLLDLF